jgi:hypothetical protein
MAMCHFNSRPERTYDAFEEPDEEEPEESEDPDFAEMEEAEDVRIVTDGGDE